VVDIFDEVEEQLRGEKYVSLFRRILPWAGGLLAGGLIAALAVWGWTSWQSQRISKASEDYSAAVQYFQEGDKAKAFAKFGDVAHSAPEGYKVLALNQQGGLRLEEGKIAEAVVFFDQAAAATRDPFLKDLSRLKAAFALMDTATLADTQKRLDPLTEEGRPFRLNAREGLAFAKLQAGKTDEARAAFLTLSTTLGVPDNMKQRAGAAIAVIDSGSAKILPQIVKAAMALPPSSALPSLPQADR
jgi:hypothetical protein